MKTSMNKTKHILIRPNHTKNEPSVWRLESNG